MKIKKGMKLVLDNKEYIVLEDSASGGNGDIRFVKSIIDGQEYAIKFLKETENNKDKRFANEIEFSKTCNHPNIIKVYGSGEYEGKLYYIMKRYPNTLEDFIKNSNDISAYFNVLIQLGNAIKYVHNAEIIHRDIKPENVFIDEEQNVVLADFGIAHFIDSTITKPNNLMANRNYAAPEQKVKNNSNKVSSACDIYAFGLIINELFTKQKPDGFGFIPVSDMYPFLYPIDKLINQCIAQNPAERPKIDEVLMELTLLKGQLKDDLEEIKESISTDNKKGLSDIEFDKIVNTASEDLLSAKYLLKNKSLDELEKYNTNYHSNISYTINEELKSMLFQKFFLKYCIRKFNYESNVYSKGKVYHSLDLNNGDDHNRYKKLMNILDKYKVPDDYRYITNSILKNFSSCCDYHCDELLHDVSNVEKIILEIDNSPLIYIIYRLKNILDNNEIDELYLENAITVNWEYSWSENKSNNLIQQMDNREVNILKKFEDEWKITYSKIASSCYSIKFNSIEQYEKFKNYSLELAKPYYIFEGDVLDLIKINREYGGVVELKPIDSFGINNTIAKIIGLRNDY